MSQKYVRAFRPTRIADRVAPWWRRESMLAFAQLALSLSLPAQKPAVAGKQFRRVTDVFYSQPTTSAVDVVNVLGSWDTYAQVHGVAQRAA